MPPKRTPSGTAQEWMKRAKGNLARAKQPKPKEAFWDDLCFDAQQAAEKSIKAVLVHRRIEFPRTHNLRSLLELFGPDADEVPKGIWDAVDLTNYAVARWDACDRGTGIKVLDVAVRYEVMSMTPDDIIIALLI